MNESGCARAVVQSIAKAGRKFFRRMTKLEIAAVVSGSKTRLRKMIPLVRDFLREQLGLELNMDKVAIYSAYRGVVVHLHRIHTWASPRILQPISSALAG